MFAKVITGLTLANEVADTLFPHINGSRFRGDVSFTATMRALMYKRVQKEESIRVDAGRSRYTKEDISGVRPSGCVSSFLSGSRIFTDHGVLHVHSFDSSEESNDACFHAIDNGGMAEMSGYTEMKDMSVFMGQKKIKARFFINLEKNNTLIFIDRLDLKKWHLLQAFIPRYFPAYFESAPLEEDERKLLKSLTTRYDPEYEKQIEEFAKRFDFRTQAIRNKLSGFELHFERENLEKVRSNIAYARDEIKSLNERFKECYKKISDLTTKELGLIEKLRSSSENEGEDTEFMEYFLCNKALHLLDVYGSSISFIVKTTISNFDPEVFDAAINKRGSFFYRSYDTHRRYPNEEMTDDRIKRLMLAIFRDEKLKLRVCAAFRLDFGNGEYMGYESYDFPREIIADHTPNQHIQKYGCFGNNGIYVREAMLDRDYVRAVAQCCAVAANINFTEANTCTYFMQEICAVDAGRIIQMPDGSTMTPLDAVKWLEEQEGKREESEHE